MQELLSDCAVEVVTLLLLLLLLLFVVVVVVVAAVTFSEQYNIVSGCRIAMEYGMYAHSSTILTL